MNKDGRRNSIDAALILQFDAGLITSLAHPGNADINQDGRINSIDAALILQFDAGLIDNLPPPRAGRRTASTAGTSLLASPIGSSALRG